MTNDGLTYEMAGVNIKAGEDAVNLMKESVRRTHNENVLTDLGLFGSVIRIPGTSLVLVQSMDGVGTRIKTAIMADRHETSGQALVAHCINDILTLGCATTSFLDYYASAKIVPEEVARVIRGAAEECEKQGVVVAGGETAEMKGFYTPGIYDFVGSVAGVMNESQLITGKRVAPGDKIIGLRSDGLHTNGYTLVNELVFEIQKMGINDKFPWGTTVADELLKPHRCYAKSVLPLMEWGYVDSPIKAAAHITGGGPPGNIVRPLPEGCRAFLDPWTWEILPIFEWVREVGNQPIDDWRKTFNLGIGFVLIVDPEHLDMVMKALEDEGETVYVIGEIKEGERGVEFTG